MLLHTPMKNLLAAACFLATVLFAAPLLAQSDAKANAEPNAPQAQVALFFQQISEGRVETAYDQLLKGTRIVELPKDVGVLKTKTKEAIRAFGEINGFDLVSEKKVGSRLTSLTCVSLGKQFPIRWRFYFYKADEKWKLIDIRIDDRLMDMFEEPSPAAASNGR